MSEFREHEPVSAKPAMRAWFEGRRAGVDSPTVEDQDVQSQHVRPRSMLQGVDYGGKGG